MARLFLVVLAAALALPAPASAIAPFRPAGTTASDRAVDVARAAVDQRPGLVDGAQTEDLTVADTERGVAGSTVVRMVERVDGVPVLGGEVVVAVDRDRRVVAASGEVLDGPAPDVDARIGRRAAIAVAREAAAEKIDGALTVEYARLAIYDPRILGTPGLPRATLVWDVRIGIPGSDQWQRVMVDADRGVVAFQVDDTPYAMDRVVCDAGNAALDYPCQPSRYVKTETTSPAVTNADIEGAFTFAGQTYDYFAALGRDSIDNAGMSLVSTVRFCDGACPYHNAFWNGSQMTYGAGYAVDDVVAHELTHGVTEYSSGLFYWYQSGAINEALSDIHGEFVDLANPGTGAAADQPGDRWEIGEDLAGIFPIGDQCGGGVVLRDMADPTVCGHPDRVGNTLHYRSGADDNGGVHSNSGVVNKAAYLIADGNTFNGQTVTGIGLEKSARLWYQTGLLLRSGSDFADLAVALQQACGILRSAGAVTASDCTQVDRAIAATELTASTASTAPADAPVCSSGTRVDLFADGFEDGIGTRWATSTAGAANVNAGWFTSGQTNPFDFDATFAASGTENVWGNDPPGISDARISMTSDVTIPAGTAYLRFAHAYGFELVAVSGGTATVAGGVVEYSTNGGSTWTDINALTKVNGYTGTVSSGGGNPIAGQPAFVGYSKGYRTTRVDLSGIPGGGDRSVRFRFRIGSGNGGSEWGDYGWFIDDVAIYTCPGSASQPLVTVSAVGADARATGSVVSSPSAIACDVGNVGTCAAPASGSVVTLTAVPGLGSVFTGWSGACTGTAPRCTVTGLQAASATATFAKPEYAVAVDVAGTGGGTIAGAGSPCTEDCTRAVARATTVTLAATPDAGSTFEGWSGGVCSGTDPCAVTVFEARAVTATFSDPAPTITSFTSSTQSPTRSTTIGFSVTFSESVTGFASGDISLGGTSGSVGTWTVSSVTGTGAGPYTFTAANASAVDGTVVATIGAGSVLDARRVANTTPAAAATAAVTLDRTAPVVTISQPAAGEQLADATPTVAGACTTGDGVVAVAVTGTGVSQSLSAPCVGGRFAVDAEPLGYATYAVAATQTDAAGNVGASTSRSFSVAQAVQGSSPTSTPTPTPTPAPAEPAAPDAPTLSPRAVVWVPPTSTGAVSSRFPAAAGTTYRMTAVFQGRRGTRVAGRCAVRRGIATCTVKLRKGRWLVAVTPVANGVAGQPVTRAVRVR